MEAKQIMPMGKQTISLTLQILLIGLFIFTGHLPQSYAQEKAFDQLTIGISVPQAISENQFTNSWDPSPGAQLFLQTPFYAGHLEGGIRYLRFNHSEEQPTYSDFHSAFIYLGWGYSFDLTSKLSAGPTIRFGNNQMLYDDPKIYTDSFAYAFDDNESEFTYELLLHTQFDFSQKWKAHAELALNRTMTYHPLRLTFITVGFSYSLVTPSWFKDFLK